MMLVLGVFLAINVVVSASIGQLNRRLQRGTR